MDSSHIADQFNLFPDAREIHHIRTSLDLLIMQSRPQRRSRYVPKKGDWRRVLLDPPDSSELSEPEVDDLHNDDEESGSGLVKEVEHEAKRKRDDDEGRGIEQDGDEVNSSPEGEECPRPKRVRRRIPSTIEEEEDDGGAESEDVDMEAIEDWVDHVESLPSDVRPSDSARVAQAPQWIDEGYDYSIQAVRAQLRAAEQGSSSGLSIKNGNCVQGAVGIDAIFPPGVPISAIEILTFYPNHIMWPKVALRLMSNGYTAFNIAEIVTHFRTDPSAAAKQRIIIRDIFPLLNSAFIEGKGSGNAYSLAKDKKKPIRNLKTDRLLPPSNLTGNGTTALFAPTFEDLLQGLHRFPKDMHARILTTCLTWYISGPRKWGLEFNVLHAVWLDRALKIPKVRIGNTNVNELGLNDWRKDGPEEDSCISVDRKELEKKTEMLGKEKEDAILEVGFPGAGPELASVFLGLKRLEGIALGMFALQWTESSELMPMDIDEPDKEHGNQMTEAIGPCEEEAPWDKESLSSSTTGTVDRDYEDHSSGSDTEMEQETFGSRRKSKNKVKGRANARNMPTSMKRKPRANKKFNTEKQTEKKPIQQSRVEENSSSVKEDWDQESSGSNADHVSDNDFVDYSSESYAETERVGSVSKRKSMKTGKKSGKKSGKPQTKIRKRTIRRSDPQTSDIEEEPWDKSSSEANADDSSGSEYMNSSPPRSASKFRPAKSADAEYIHTSCTAPRRPSSRLEKEKEFGATEDHVSNAEYVDDDSVSVYTSATRSQNLRESIHPRTNSGTQKKSLIIKFQIGTSFAQTLLERHHQTASSQSDSVSDEQDWNQGSTSEKSEDVFDNEEDMEYSTSSRNPLSRAVNPLSRFPTQRVTVLHSSNSESGPLEQDSLIISIYTGTFFARRLQLQTLKNRRESKKRKPILQEDNTMERDHLTEEFARASSTSPFVFEDDDDHDDLDAASNLESAHEPDEDFEVDDDDLEFSSSDEKSAHEPDEEYVDTSSKWDWRQLYK